MKFRNTQQNRGLKPGNSELNAADEKSIFLVLVRMT